MDRPVVMSSCPGKSASLGGDGATAAWRNTLATNEPQIKPGPENNNTYHGHIITRETSHGSWVSYLEREMEAEHDQMVRVNGNIFGWSCG